MQPSCQARRRFGAQSSRRRRGGWDEDAQSLRAHEDLDDGACLVDFLVGADEPKGGPVDDEMGTSAAGDVFTSAVAFGEEPVEERKGVEAGDAPDDSEIKQAVVETDAVGMMQLLPYWSELVTAMMKTGMITESEPLRI